MAGGWLATGAAAEKSAYEPFFPHAGNRGYDVYSYEVDLAYGRAGRVDAETTIYARANEELNQFSLDFFGPRVKEVRVASGAARFQRKPGKLIVSPKEAIPAGKFAVKVTYSGVPPTITDPDGTEEGWYQTDDGALAVGEPQGAAAWIPCNNIPADKASFSFDVTVPASLKAIANGGLVGTQRHGGRTTYSWEEGRPMSTYLAVLDIGRGRLVKSNVAGHRAWTLVDPRMEKQARPVLAALPEIVRFESRLYGPYPFVGAGSIVDYAPKLGYALETQGRPIYPYVPDLTTVVHETAHQWFGDSVGLKRWPEIWLNEGFATWTEWYYAEQHGRRSAHAIFNRLYRVPASNKAFWDPPSAHPGSAKNLFGPSIYIRGAMALEALRLKIGTQPMLRVLRGWATEHRYGSGTIKEFIALAEEISGQGLDPFFQRWLYRRGKP
ncbi:MAG TPA: M1 family metallopeptidase [Solirubrobacterales bacterium]|jgi:aminopeptidase N|nr:M1 family metallopeptidase [Solirubrobacterales bacterium]